MNQTLTLDSPDQLTKRKLCVELKWSQTKTRIAQQRVSSSNYAEVRCIQCDVRNEVLYLRGQVSSFYLKQMTQEAVRSMEGIEAISNCIEVNDPVQNSRVAFD
jgi:osmotically-inducible protein OsmY